MKVKEAVKKLEELRGKGSSLTPSDKMDIEGLHETVLGRKLKRTSCSDCYQDAIVTMLLYIRKYGKFREKTAYRLKNGVLLQPEFGSSQFYTNDNLTDKVAEEYLAKYPDNIKLFAVYPEDWEVRIQMKSDESPDEEPEEKTEEVNESKGIKK